MEGTRLLLETLRGKYINWGKLEKEHIPRKWCHTCEDFRYKDDFASATEFASKTKPAFCQSCRHTLKNANKSYCVECDDWATPQIIETKKRQEPETSYRVRVHICGTCQEKKTKGQIEERECKLGKQEAATKSNVDMRELRGRVRRFTRAM